MLTIEETPKVYQFLHAMGSCGMQLRALQNRGMTPAVLFALSQLRVFRKDEFLAVVRAKPRLGARS